VRRQPVYGGFMRRAPWIALFAAACAGGVESSIRVTPPEAPPAATGDAVAAPASAVAPADEDGDGVAADRCPAARETMNEFEDDDGCPDEVPVAYVAGHDLRYRGELAFGAAGGLASSSQPIVDGIAALLLEHGDIELVEVGGHLAPTEGKAEDLAKKGRERAEALAKALEKAGVDKKRLRVAGYGARCAEVGTRVVLTIVRRAGADTGAVLCGSK
jgi:hypothetical protein